MLLPVSGKGSPAHLQCSPLFLKNWALIRKPQKRLSCGFGAGISKTGNICGAVSGAIMVIGMKYGKTKEGDDAATEKTRALVRKFHAGIY